MVVLQAVWWLPFYARMPPVAGGFACQTYLSAMNYDFMTNVV